MSKLSNKEYNKIDQDHYLQTFKRFPVTLDRGKGSYLWDVEGKKYLDFLAGIAVNSLGHSHPKIVKAIQDQVEKLTHVSNFFLSVPQVKLSEKLTSISGLDRVFFSNSGAESVEGAIKIARKYAHSIGRGGTIISFNGSFHGRTLATIATGKKKMQDGFGPIPHGFKKAEFNHIDSVKDLIDKETAAIIIEPIQGEGGINPASKTFLNELRELCDKENIVLIFDEIQCGIGRTGYWFAKDHYNVEPDIMTLAKALGSGVPIGAILSNEKVSAAIDFGDHGTTFGGNPLACAASLAALEAIEDENLMENATKSGLRIKDLIRNLNEPSIVNVRGLGLMIGIEFDFPTKDLVSEMLCEGVIANSTAENVLRIVPPLIIGQEEMMTFISVLQSCLEKVKPKVS